jgi:hypothetical protein
VLPHVTFREFSCMQHTVRCLRKLGDIHEEGNCAGSSASISRQLF